MTERVVSVQAPREKPFLATVIFDRTKPQVPPTIICPGFGNSEGKCPWAGWNFKSAQQCTLYIAGEQPGSSLSQEELSLLRGASFLICGNSL